MTMQIEMTAAVDQQAGSFAKARIVMFALLMVLLNAQGDGLPLGHNETHRQLLLIPFTLLFCVGLYGILWPKAVTKRIPGFWLRPYSWKDSLAIATVFLILAAGIFVAASYYYELPRFAPIGYHFYKATTWLVFGGSLLLIASNFTVKGQSDGRYLFSTVLVAYTAIYLLSIFSRPLNVLHSDMLPLLSEAGKTLLSHQNPYRLYTWPTDTVFLTYLPGTVLAFIPATVMHFDVRFLNICFVLLLAVLIYVETDKHHRQEAAALISLFLLAPYLIYRHEIYTEPHWLSVVAGLLLARRGKLFWAAVLFGVGISLSQFSWVLFPFFFLFVFQRRGLGHAFYAGTVSLLTAAVIVAPFLAWSPRAFYYGVLGHWHAIALNVQTINLSYWTASIIGANHLQLAQAVVLFGIFIYCAATKSCSSLEGSMRWMLVALTCFILLNVLTWGYFFLLIEVMLIFYIVYANGWLRQRPQ